MSVTTTRHHRQAPAIDEAAAARMAFADAALALAGHEVTDEPSRAILEKHARREISGDEAREQIRKLILG